MTPSLRKLGVGNQIHTEEQASFNSLESMAWSFFLIQIIAHVFRPCALYLRLDCSSSRGKGLSAGRTHEAKNPTSSTCLFHAYIDICLLGYG